MRLVEQALADAEALALPVVRAQLLRLRAQAHAALGNVDAARAAVEASIAASAAAGASYEHAFALLVAAALVDDPETAAEREKTAAGVLDRLGVVRPAVDGTGLSGSGLRG